MLTIQDKTTIKHYVMSSLDKEPGVNVQGVYAKAMDGFIAVGVEALLHDQITAKSAFRLKPEYQIADLTKEIDEMAEQFKAAWRHHLGLLTDRQADKIMAGNGLAGNWKQ